MDSPGSSPEPADWDILPVDAHSELSQQADAYAASSQPVEAAVQTPQQPISSDNQSQQQSAEAVTQLMPLDELPTFELPGEADWQADREAAGGAAAAAAMSVVQHAAAVRAAHDSHMQPDTQLQQHWQAQQASSAPQSPPAAAAGSEPLPVALPHIDEAAVDALRTALQQQDDQQLLQEAAAVGGRGSVPTAADTDAMGLPGPQLSDGDGCQREPESSPVSQLQHLDLQDRHQQQQQQHRQHQLQAPSAVPQKQQQQHGQLDLDELLQPGSGGGSMDLDRDASADIPVLQQPQRPRTQHDAAYAVLPPGAAKKPWPGLGGLPGGAPASVHRVVGEGLGPQDFGLPVEAPPVLPDEPAQLLQVPEQPTDGFLL